MARLALLGEDQDRLGVLVLHAGQRLVGEGRNVQRQLSGRMRVEPHPDRMRGGLDLPFGRAAGQQRRDGLDVLGWQHVSLREDQPVDRVVRRGRPVDQRLHDVVVRPKRQHRGHSPNRQPLRIAQAGPGSQLVQVLRGVCAEPPALRGD